MKKLVLSVGGLIVALVMVAGCGDDSTGDCTPNDHTSCMQDVTYWMDSCGSQGTVAEICDCGCNVDFTGCDQNCSCTVDCSGRDCGDDGCGGSCGTCTTGEVCTTAGQCIVCTPDCAGRECGDNGCEGICGTCDTGETCNTAGQCVSCTPDCTGKDCGDDGCGGSCGDCTGSDQCSAAGTCEAAVSDTLSFECTVPYILDDAQVADINYMTSHFSHLIQEYCIVGAYDGFDINAFPEKMFYGSHDAGNTLKLTQISMGASPTLEPQWSVKVEFTPDTDFVTGASWTAAVGGLNPPEAIVGLILHLGGSNVCLKAIGTTGTFNVVSAVDSTAIEGGSFTLTGQVQLTDPWDFLDYCSSTPPELPCCS